MKKQDKLYDVYVSYPPDVDRERINACLYDNLPEKEAEDLVQALADVRKPLSLKTVPKTNVKTPNNISII